MKALNRWIYAVVGVIVLLFAGLIYAWSVLVTPISQEFTNWSNTSLSLTFTICMIFFCLGGLIGGLLQKKIDVKINVWLAAVLFLIGFFISSKAQSIATLYVGYGVLAGFASGLAYNSVMSTMSKWFLDKQGLISGILLMGFGLGSFIIGKIYQAYTPTDIGGWRTSFMIFGIILVIVLGIGGFF
ncbi:MAG: MFS transporter, partial [Intestinibacter sp.]|uniref:MFS transporter n=1 Tax=Intestinibacter sp. TaxID=1965304 RepID=UPI003F17C943